MKVFGYDIITKITPILISLILFLALSVSYFILTILNFKNQKNNYKLKVLESNSSPLVNT